MIPSRKWMAGAALALALAALLSVSAARAAQLVMFDSRYCPFCKRWKEEIGGYYHKTDEGRRAPLRIVDKHGKRPEDLKNIKGIHYTPTFVLIDDEGREVGRMEGYNGDEFFFARLDALLAKLKKPASRDGGKGETGKGRKP